MQGYCFIGDLLGFAKIVENSSAEELPKRVQEWVDLVKKAISKYEVNHIQMISDTVFAATESSTNDFRKLVDFARYLLSNGINQSLPIRGAITYGSYEWGQLTYGKSVIRAHDLEIKQNWIGVTCDNNLPHIDELWGLDSLICYPVPMKDGSVELYPVVAWDVPQFSNIVRALTGGGLTKKGEKLSWDWAEKVNNTVQFSMYRSFLAKHAKSGKKFYGFLPLQVFSEPYVMPEDSE